MSSTLRFGSRPAPAYLFVIVLAAALALPALAAPPATAPFDRTIIVNGGDTDANNGAALLTAINDAVLAGASSTDPWLVKVEPGVFDIGTATLDLQNFVDVEGSGRNATFIRSQGDPLVTDPATVTVAAGVDAELRNLTVQFLSDQIGGVGIKNSSTELKVTQVNVEVEVAGTGQGILNLAGDARYSAVFPRVSSTIASPVQGVEIRAGSPIVNEMFVFILSGGANIGVGVRAGDAVLEQISMVVAGAGNNLGFLVANGSPRITNARVTVDAGDNGTGLAVRFGADVLVQESTFDVTAAGTTGNGIVNDRATLTLQTSRVVLTNQSGQSAIFNRQRNSLTRIDQSVVRGPVSIQNGFGTSTFRVGTTWLDGPRALPTGVATCAFSYDSAYAPVPANCL